MIVKVLGIFGLLLVLCGFMAVMTAEPWYRVTGSTFLQPNNVENLLRRTAMYGILGIGVAFVIISSGIDLSIGSIVCLSGCLLALFLQVQYRPFDYQPILEVRGQAREIVVAGEAPGFAEGDRIRYFGGRRARNALVTVQLSAGAMTLTVKGQALGSAAAGEPVDVLNTVTKKILHGIARADGVVTIPTATTVASL